MNEDKTNVVAKNLANAMNLKEIKECLLKASDRQLDASMFPLIRNWSETPTSLQVLEVLDKCIFGSLASGFVVTILQVVYDQLLKDEHITHEHNVPLAVWRKELI